MANSLLAHMYSRIRGSQEDVATIALQYLITQSSELNSAFTNLIEDKLNTKLSNNLQYSCQSVGEDKERPDMAGTDQNGNEIVLCEMKFYAGLTHNQPLGYIDRLKVNAGIGLVFICPKSRQTSLWSKLKELCTERTVEFINNHCVEVDGIRMAIATWAEVIESIRSVAAATSSAYLSDIHQLKGFCDQMDSDAFIPFAPDDLTADKAIKQERYYSVVDEVYNLLSADESIHTESMGKASSYRTGYERKILIDETPVYFSFDRGMWKSNASTETPFWVAVGDGDIQAHPRFRQRLSSMDDVKKEDGVWSLTYFPLDPPIDATFDEVCLALKTQIINYVNIVKSYINQ